MDGSRQQLVDALVSAIRDALIEGHRIDVPRLGTFSVRHIPSRVERDDDKAQVMVPPRDVVDFEPESEDL